MTTEVQRGAEFARLEPRFQSPDVELRREALFTLARLEPGQDLLERVMQVAVRDESAILRAEALKLHQELKEQLTEFLKARVQLRPYGHLEVTELYACLNSEEVDIRVEALRQLVENPDPRGSDLVFASLKREANPLVIAGLLRAGGLTGKASQLGLVQPFLKHGEHEVVKAAIDAVCRLGGDLAGSMVRPFVRSTHAGIRQEATQQLAKLDPDALAGELKELAQSGEEEKQDAALDSLPLLPPAVGSVLAVELLSEESHPARLRKLGRFIGENGTQEAMEPLGPLLKSSSLGRAKTAREARQNLAARLRIPIEEVVAQEVHEEKEREKKRSTVRMSALAPGQAAAARAQLSGAVNAVVAGPASPAAGLRALNLTEQQKKIGAIAAGALTVLVVAVVALRPGSGGDDMQSGGEMVHGTHPALVEVAAGRSAAAVKGQQLSFEGQVVGVQTEPRGVTLITGPCLVHVTLDPEGTKSLGLDGLQRGAKLKVTGSLEGKTPFGGLKFQAKEASLEKG